MNERSGTCGARLFMPMTDGFSQSRGECAGPAIAAPTSRGAHPDRGQAGVETAILLSCNLYWTLLNPWRIGALEDRDRRSGATTFAITCAGTIMQSQIVSERRACPSRYTHGDEVSLQADQVQWPSRTLRLLQLAIATLYRIHPGIATAWNISGTFWSSGVSVPPSSRSDHATADMALQAVGRELQYRLPQLRLIVPVAAGALWFFRSLRGHKKPPEELLEGKHDDVRSARSLPNNVVVLPAAAPLIFRCRAPTPHAQADGTPCSVELPKAAPPLPFSPPPPLGTRLVDVELPLSLPALWAAVFSGGSQLLLEFHRAVGDVNISYGAWMQKGGR